VKKIVMEGEMGGKRGNVCPSLRGEANNSLLSAGLLVRDTFN